MGNCSTSDAKIPSARAIPKIPTAPIPNLVSSELGVVWTHRAFGKLKDVYVPERTKHTDAGLDKVAAHKKALESEDVQEYIGRLTTELDNELGVADKAGKAQDKMMNEMGSDNPEKKVPRDVPGAEASWEAAKEEAQGKASEKVLTEVVEEFLLQKVDDETLVFDQ